MLVGVQDVQQIGRRIDARPAGEVVLDKEPHIERLRFDVEGLRAEGAGQIEQFLVVRAGREDAFAFRQLGDDGLVGPLPFDADHLDAEVILRMHLEGESFGIEDDLLSGQVFARERRGLVIARRDRDRERFQSPEPEFILPLEDHLARGVDLRRCAGHIRGEDRRGLTVNRGTRQITIRGDGERRHAAIHQ